MEAAGLFIVIFQMKTQNNNNPIIIQTENSHICCCCVLQLLSDPETMNTKRLDEILLNGWTETVLVVYTSDAFARAFSSEYKFYVE